MKKPARLIISFFFLAALLLWSLNVPAVWADVIIDNRDTDTSQIGYWEVSGASDYYGIDSVWARGGDDTFTFRFTPDQSGNYEVFERHSPYYSRTTAAPHRITHDGGATTVPVNQKLNGDQWNSLGVFAFTAWLSYEVGITSVAGSSSTCADAMRWTLVGSGPTLPTAVIDTIAPSPASEGQTVNFDGHGNDPGGWIIGYQWSSNLDDVLSTVASFSTSDLTVGTHTISFQVRDNDDNWSAPVTRSLTVTGTSQEVIIDNGDPQTSHTGTWRVSSALDPYGATSVYSRDGYTYTWTFTPLTSGTYELSMWWTQYYSRSTSIPVRIENAGSTDTVTINQKVNGGKWNILGSYAFEAGVPYDITITSQPGPSSTCADAVRFVLTNLNLKPVATIVSIDPKAAIPEDTITFNGSGDDSDGWVTDYEWSSDIDGILSNQETFTTTSLTPGTHTISFRVRDDQDEWSKAVTRLVVVRDCDSPVTIMLLGDSITYGIGEVSDVELIKGYREPLFESLKSAGYYFDFVGAESTGLLVLPPFDINHEGFPGIPASEVAANVYNQLVAHPAEIVLLHIGTNYFTTDPSHVEDILNEIDRYEADYGTDITVVLARIINHSTYDPDFTIFNINLQNMADARIAAGDKIVVVDQESALDYATDMWNYGHPNNIGYDKMAAVWMDALTDLLPTCADFGPFIFSTPVLSAIIGQPYTYTVGALGNPTATYTLLAAPTGMNMDPVTGAISWTQAAGQEGSHPVSVQASSLLGTDTQSFNIAVSQGATIIDNGDPQTSHTGTWGVSSALDPYGAASVWSRNGYTYTWTFTPLTSGTYELSMWWTQYYSRSTSIPVRIENAGSTDTVTINQKVNGGQWNFIGSYAFTAGVSYNIRITSQPGPSSTCADAVKFVLH